MRIEKIYVISLDANKVEAQQRIVEKIDSLKMPYTVKWEIVPAFDGRSGDLLPGTFYVK